MKEPPYTTNELAEIRTELAFQRNRLAADRTIMAVMRTSLALISFGFTIFSVFKSLAEWEPIGRAFRDETPGRFGLALVTFGILLLVAGIISDVLYMRRLRAQYGALLSSPTFAGSAPLPRSIIVISALLLVLLGLLAFLVIIARL
jgi:putative membrane protein